MIISIQWVITHYTPMTTVYVVKLLLIQLIVNTYLIYSNIIVVFTGIVHLRPMISYS